MKITSLEPTVFFRRVDGRLAQQVRVGVANDGGRRDAHLRLRAPSVEAEVPLGPVPPGESCHDAEFPDLREPAEIAVALVAAGQVQDRRTLSWTPQRHWDVHLVHYSHHDLGYTDLPSNVLREYDGFLDQALRFCAATEDWPDADARFRYQCEQAWSVVHYVEHRPPEVVARLMHYVRNGQIEITALFGNQTLELCSTEELIRLLYPAFRLKRDHGIAISSAEHNDIPGFPWGLASVLAGAGVRYFSPGVPLWYFGEDEDRVHPLWDPAAALPLDVPAACWWEGPDGARVLLWSDLHGREWQPYNVDQALAELPGMLAELEAGAYPYDMVSYTLRGGHRDNAPPSLRYAYLVREWNRRWAYPHLINTTNTPFLRAFEARWGDALTTLRGDVPGTDYPVAATCTPQETAVDRTTHAMLTTAEVLATMAALHGQRAVPRRRLDEAYRQTFTYDLHCWGLSHVAGPAQDAHLSEKRTLAYRAAALAHDVALKAANALADQIAYPESGPEGGHYVTVFNPLAHARDAEVRVPLRTLSPCGSPMFWQSPSSEDDAGWPSLVSGRALGRRIVDPPASLLDTPFEVRDAGTGARVPFQLARLDGPRAARRWAPERWALGKVDPRHLTDIVLAPGALPPLGYRTFEVVPCAAWPSFGDGAAPAGDPPEVVETPAFRLTLDPARGGVVSLYDKVLARELVDAEAPHVLGQLIVRSSETGAEETLAVSDVAVVAAGPLYTTLRLQGAAPACPQVTVEITLWAPPVRRIDLRARILRDATPMRELYLAFPFLVDAPRFRFAGPGAVVEPLRDQWPGSNTDTYAVQAWAHVGNDDWGITWTAQDTPIAEFGGLWPGYVSGAHHGVRGPDYGHPFLRPGELRRGHIYAMISYHNFRTNFANVWPGEVVVRYAFTPHQGDWRQAHAWQVGREVTHPPLAVWMQGPGPGPLPLSRSFCRVDAPNVVVLTVKGAEDGDGIIVRLMETAGQPTEATVTFPSLSIRHALAANLVEENQRLLSSTEHSVTLDVPAYALRTLRLRARM
jgi:hypothetical protein